MFTPHTHRLVLHLMCAALLISFIAVAIPVSAADEGKRASEELADMYKQDQDDRTSMDTSIKSQEWTAITAHDKIHYNRVLELMRTNKIKSGDDYYYAAMIMQHGDKPEDFMLAHIFACAAAQKGSKPAIWLSAASFDRLMQHVGQPQIFGTQFLRKLSEPWTMDPMNSELISDQVRRDFGVPRLKKNKAHLVEMNKLDPK